MAGLEGRTLNDFALRRLLGRGGMADVYLAESVRTGREVAVKVFKREDEEMLRRFVREARLMASLHHSHLMPVYDTGAALVDGVNRYYIVMPYIDGGTLRGRIHKTPLPLQEICVYLSEIASALDYIHSQGIIHRDIKSSNVLVSRDGYCYLSDFGIARTVSDVTQMTSTGNVLGTVDYVAPELFEPDHKADERSDYYSLGVLLYEMVTGRLPFLGENQIAIVSMHVSKRPPLPGSLVPGLPKAVERVVLKALAKDPAQRYPSARALAEAFCQATQVPDQAMAVPVASEVRESEKKPPLVLPSPSAQRGVRPAPLDEATVGFHQPEEYGQAERRPVQPKRQVSATQKRGRIVAVLAILALLAVIVPIAYTAVQTQKHKSSPGASGTAQAGGPQVTATMQKSATATPDTTATARAGFQAATAQAVHQTATAVAGMTATVQAQASATAGVVQTATAQTPIYSDQLTNSSDPNTVNAQWDSNSNCVFSQEGYHVVTGLFQLKGCREQGKVFTDGTISVNMVLLSGASAGIFFRVNTNAIDAYAGYLFESDAQGNYTLSHSDNYSVDAEVTLKSGKVVSGWKTGKQAKNALEIIVNKGAISLYANGIYLVTVNDATSTSGVIGFGVRKGADGQQGEAIFSDLKTYPL